jgi:hypothetical protein
LRQRRHLPRLIASQIDGKVVMCRLLDQVHGLRRGSRPATCDKRTYVVTGTVYYSYTLSK